MLEVSRIVRRGERRVWAIGFYRVLAGEVVVSDEKGETVTG